MHNKLGVFLRLRRIILQFIGLGVFMKNLPTLSLTHSSKAGFFTELITNLQTISKLKNVFSHIHFLCNVNHSWRGTPSDVINHR